MKSSENGEYRSRCVRRVACFSAPRNRPSSKALIVKDQMLVALDLATMIEEQDFEVVSPVSSVRPALEPVRAGVDAAVLDMNPGGGATSFPIAEALKARGSPSLSSPALNSETSRHRSLRRRGC